ncbi:MAG TPA: HAMP domain-containing sensor histidine kinase [Gemmatimonadaceae bacterium]|jgi:signal transduction histidine kinase|nr:HAMP domain-containing sensor histidine kinase [Gemmatimonadaceae bacterium]
MRRLAPVTLITIGVLALLTWYVIYTRGVVRELRQEASRVGLMYARVYNGLSDPNPDAANGALLDLSRHIRESGLPMILADPEGVPTDTANIPFTAPLRSRAMRNYILELDRQNVPIVEPGIGTVHFGNTPLVRGLILIPLLQSILIGMVLIAGAYALRTRGRADREQIWAGMARESAHQLGTPLSSISGWIELLRETEPEETTSAALDHMEADLERLKRVAHRFERIGRPPRQESVNLGQLVDRVAAYFRARVPTLAQRVTVSSSHQGELVVQGDEVLLEWALESLTKNAIDALAGRDGRVDISAVSLPEGRVRVRVADDGPGVPREIRHQIFDPGFSTKEKGWGIGLSLARRIVRDSHGGELLLVPSERGATFDMVLG